MKGLNWQDSIVIGSLLNSLGYQRLMATKKRRGDLRKWGVWVFWIAYRTGNEMWPPKLLLCECEAASEEVVG